MPRAHLEILAALPFSYLDTLNAVDDAIDRNAKLSLAIWKAGLESFGILPQEKLQSREVVDWRGKATSNDLEKARSTLRQFYRDVRATRLFISFYSFSGSISQVLLLHLTHSSCITRELDLLVLFASLRRLSEIRQC